MSSAAPPIEAPPPIPWRIRMRRKLETLGARGLAWRVRRISRERALRLADQLAGYAPRLWFLKRNRKTARAQIELMLDKRPDEIDSEAILQASIRSLSRTMVDFLRFPLYSREDIIALAGPAVGQEHWDAYRASSRGAVIGLGMHIGSWEYAGAHVVTDLPMAAAGKAQRDAAITDLALDIRGGVGIDVFLSQENSRKLIETVRSKEKMVLGLIADQNGGRDGVFVPMCGRLASCVKGPGFLMRRYKVPAMLLAAVWHGDHYRMVYGPMIETFDTGDIDRDSLLNTARIHAHYLALIRAYPEQWLWLHRRFKSTVDLVPPAEYAQRVLTEEQWAPYREQCTELAGLTERLRGA